MVKTQRLSDGKRIHPLSGEFDQVNMFGLKNSGLFNPQIEDIATTRQLNDAFNVVKIYPDQTLMSYKQQWFGRSIDKQKIQQKKLDKLRDEISEESWIRSDTIGFYKKEFQQIGTKLFWVEKQKKDSSLDEIGKLLVAILDLSAISNEKVTLADGTETTLKQATGLGWIPLSKCVIKKIEDNEKIITYEVSVDSSNFNQTDLKVKDVLRRRGWTIKVDEDCCPLNGEAISDDIGWKNENARFSSVIHTEDFLNITKLPKDTQKLLAKLGVNSEGMGWFGSVAYCTGFYTWDFYNDNRRSVFFSAPWPTMSRVVLVDR
ncbi:MAG: hypothetical protein AB1391_00105 [Candidatus Micrarchaeota archaeon]